MYYGQNGSDISIKSQSASVSLLKSLIFQTYEFEIQSRRRSEYIDKGKYMTLYFITSQTWYLKQVFTIS